LDFDRTTQRRRERGSPGSRVSARFSGEARPEVNVSGITEPPGASGGDDEVHRVELSPMVVEVVQIGVRWRMGGVFIERLGLQKGLGFRGGITDRMATEEAVTGPVSGARKKLTGWSHLSVTRRRRGRTLSGMGGLLGWAGFLA
jgi:hypothetical protein